MYFLLIFAVIGAVLFIIMTYDDYMPIIMRIVFALLMGFMGAIMGGLIGILVASMLPMELYDKVSYLNVETLQDNNSVKGDFFLGCGQVEGKMKYVFYVEKNGFYEMQQLDYDVVKIKYTDSIPTVKVIEKYPTESAINKWGFDWDAFDKRYIIQVPKGTIKNNYNLDAQ